ncbi:MAG: sigma-70 family RNA polymerase sigma factor [Planctomycetota bacterium]
MSEQIRAENEYRNLVSRHQTEIREFLYIICPDQTAREELLQDTNRVLLQKRLDFQLGTNFSAWARRIARFQYLSYLKRHKKKSWLSFNSELVQLLARTIEEEQESLADQRKVFLSTCIAELVQKDQLLVELKYQRQLPLSKISSLTGRSVGGLKQAFLRIRKSLGACIERKLLAGRSQND